MVRNDVRHKEPGNLNEGLQPQHGDHPTVKKPRPTPAAPAPATPARTPQPTGFNGDRTPDGKVIAPPAGAPPAAASDAANNAKLKEMEDNHAVQNKFQLDLLDLQQKFSNDQFWVTTLSAINKSADETRKDLGRAF